MGVVPRHTITHPPTPLGCHRKDNTNARPVHHVATPHQNTYRPLPRMRLGEHDSTIQRRRATPERKEIAVAQTFSYCFNCEELCYGIPSNNGVYSKDNAATNHWQCLCHNFRDPEEYSQPVKMLLIKLGAGVPIPDIEMQIAKIGLHLDDKVTPNYNGTWNAKELEAWREAWISRGRETRPMKQIKLTGQKPHPRFPNATTRLIWVYEDTGEPAHQHPEPEPALKISGTPTPTLPQAELTLF